MPRGTGACQPKKIERSEPKIAKGAASFRLPSTGLLRMAERSEKIDEDELKECARAIEQKCKEFDVGGHVTQINPGPVVTTYEFKPEAGIKYSRITGLADDLCLALRAESILIERIPGKSTVGHRSARTSTGRRLRCASHRVAGIRQFAFEADAGARQGLDRAHPRLRPGADAALADRRLDRHRQERVHQFR